MKKKKKTKTSPSPSPETDLQSPEFHTAVARTAVVQICQSVGYKSAQTSALETLTDVAVRYLRQLASSAATSAASTGRTQCNLLDILRALEDLHTYTTGFHGNSNPNRRLSSLTDSSILRETMKFVYWNREIPFAKPLPPRRRRIIVPIPTCFSGESAKPNHVPIYRTIAPIPACVSGEISKPNHISICRTIPASFSGEIAKPNHIPIWLPDFPKIDYKTGEKGEKTVIPEAIEGETESEKKMNSIGKSSVISKLPEKRQKVSFKIGCGGRVRVRNEIETKMELDLRNGICKRGKRISFQIYDDENLLNSSDHGDLKKKFEESRTKMIMMH